MDLSKYLYGCVQRGISSVGWESGVRGDLQVLGRHMAEFHLDRACIGSGAKNTDALGFLPTIVLLLGTISL